MSLLPQQIIPQTIPLGTVNPQGQVILATDWWLLLYNLCLQTLGTGSGFPADELIDLEGADLDATNADAMALRQPLASALAQTIQPADVVVSTNDLPDLLRALLFAQDPLLPDPSPLAQPVAAITVGASPFTYTAAFAGNVAITCSVTSISFKRQGTSVATGVTTGVIPVCRGDQLVVTYPGAAPTMTFIPWSSQ